MIGIPISMDYVLERAMSVVKDGGGDRLTRCLVHMRARYPCVAVLPLVTSRGERAEKK